MSDWTIGVDDRGYEPGNCRWTTAKENNRNRRDNRLITYNGETKTCAEWSELTGINYQTLQSRIHSGNSDLWPDLFAPPKRKSA